jgi:hypothetical protein
MGCRGTTLEWSAPMLRDARIKLEGQLEVLERAVASLREAIALARRNEFSLLGEVLDLSVDEAWDQIARLAPHEPELQRLQRTWIALQVEAQKVVRGRARLMRAPEQPLKRAVESLRAEAVLYEAAARHPMALLTAVVVLVMTAIEVWLMQSPWPLLLHGSLAVYLAVSVWLSPMLRVTRRRVFVGAHVFEFSELKCLEVEWLLVRSTRRYRLTAILLSGERVELRLPDLPLAFTDALERNGVAITRKGCLWF